MFFVLIIVLIVFLDQLSKYLIVRNINYGDIVTIIDRFFYLTHSKNTGAAWGILKDGRLFFIPVTIIVLVVMIYFLKKSDKFVLSVSLSMIMGGAIGNLIDRIFRDGGVIDFLEVHFGSYIYPIFNIADSFVVVGTILLGFYMIMNKDNEEAISVEIVGDNKND